MAINRFESQSLSPEQISPHRQALEHLLRLTAHPNDVMPHEEEQPEPVFRLVGDRTVLQGTAFRHLSASRYYDVERERMTAFAAKRYGVDVGPLVGQIDMQAGELDGPRFSAVIRIGEAGAHATVDIFPDVENPLSAEAAQCEDAARSIGLGDVWHRSALAVSNFSEEAGLYNLPMNDRRLEDLNAMLNLWQ